MEDFIKLLFGIVLPIIGTLLIIWILFFVPTESIEEWVNRSIFYQITGSIDEENIDSYEPEEILKRRFAKGELSMSEYTERMARL